MKTGDSEIWSVLAAAVAFFSAGIAWWAAWSAKRSAAAGTLIEFRADIQAEPSGILLCYVQGPARIRRVRIESVRKGVLKATAVPLVRPGDREIVPALSAIPVGTPLRVSCHVPGVGRISKVVENPNENPIYCY